MSEHTNNTKQNEKHQYDQDSDISASVKNAAPLAITVGGVCPTFHLLEKK